jgi:hypothetical protein
LENPNSQQARPAQRPLIETFENFLRKSFLLRAVCCDGGSVFSKSWLASVEFQIVRLISANEYQ